MYAGKNRLIIVVIIMGIIRGENEERNGLGQGEVLNCLVADAVNARYCAQCRSGYYIANGGLLCLPCDNSMCVECQTTSQTCTSCAQGKYLSSTQCLPCTQGCISCSAPTYCLNCSQGYYSTAMKYCNPCSDNCESCLSGQIGGVGVWTGVRPMQRRIYER